MKNVKLLVVSLVSFTLLLIAVTTVRAQDVVKVAPKNCKVVLENDHVRVVRVVMKPGDKIEMHSHPASILYSLTGGKTKYTSADGKTEERESKAGQATYSEAVTHASENVGTTETRSLLIELKK